MKITGEVYMSYVRRKKCGQISGSLSETILCLPIAKAVTSLWMCGLGVISTVFTWASSFFYDVFHEI